jgi:hypothetical protein
MPWQYSLILSCCNSVPVKTVVWHTSYLYLCSNSVFKYFFLATITIYYALQASLVTTADCSSVSVRTFYVKKESFENGMSQLCAHCDTMS